MTIAPSSDRYAPPGRVGFAKLAFVATAIAIVAVRLGDVPDHPFAAVRIAASFLAIAVVVFGADPRLRRRAALVMGIEVLAGATMFALVDAPFVIDHQREIALLVLDAAQHLAALAR